MKSLATRLSILSTLVLSTTSGFTQQSETDAERTRARATFAENAEIEGIRIGMTYEESLLKVKRASYTVRTVPGGRTASSEIATQIAAMRRQYPGKAGNGSLVNTLYAEKAESPGSGQKLTISFREDVTRQPAVSVVVAISLQFIFSDSTDQGLAEKQLRQAVLDKYGTPHSADEASTGPLNYFDESTGNSLRFGSRSLSLENQPFIQKIVSAREKKIEDAVNAAKAAPPKPKF